MAGTAVRRRKAPVKQKKTTSARRRTKAGSTGPSGAVIVLFVAPLPLFFRGGAAFASNAPEPRM